MPAYHGVINSSADSCEACPNGTAVAPFNASDVFQAGGGVLGWEGANVTNCGTAITTSCTHKTHCY